MALKNLAIVKAAELRKRSADYSVKSYRGYVCTLLFMRMQVWALIMQVMQLFSNYLNTTDVQSSQYILVEWN